MSIGMTTQNQSVETRQLFCTDMNSFIVYVKPEGVYADLAEGGEKIFDTSNYEVERSLPMEKNKKSD